MVNFIFGGSRERMNELAFGTDTPDLKAGADNSRLRRSPAIVQWAKDVWNFVARLFGAENIIGFYVHLDETNPHAHCTLLPIRDGKFAFKEIFCGKTRWEMALKTAGLHDRLASEVGAKWGLERGNELLSLQEDIATAKSTLTHAAGTIGQKRKEITGLETDTASAKATLKDLERQKAKADKGLSDTGKKLAEMSGTLYEAERALGDIHALKSIILALVEDFKKRLESLPQAVSRLFSGTLLGRAAQDPAWMTDNALGLYNEARREGTQGLPENHGGIRCDDSLARESLAKALAEPQCDPRVMKLRR